MKTSFSHFKSALLGAGVALVSAAVLSSCGGDDSEDLSDTIPTIPEVTLSGYELRGPIELEGTHDGVYENHILAIEFTSDSLVNITYDDMSVLMTSYSYTYSAATEGSSAVGTITIEVPASVDSEDSVGGELYELIIHTPSEYYQVALDATSAYVRMPSGDPTGTRLPLYAVNGSLNLTVVE